MENKIENINRIECNKLVAITIFIIIYFSSSYNAVVMNGTMKVGILLISSIFLLILENNVRVSKGLIFSGLTLIICILITTLIVGDALKDAFIMISAVFISMIVVSSINFSKFSNIFVKVMLVIAVFSLFAYAISIISPSIIRLFPNTYFRPHFEVYNLGLSYVNLATYQIRNMGIFWEPGAYQTYLVLAIILEVFYVRSKSRLSLIILFTALITTWSTTGLINAALLFLIYIIESNKDSKYRAIKIIVSLVIIAIIVYNIYLVLPTHLQYAVWRKITLYLNDEHVVNTSAAVRVDSIIYPIRAFFESPLVGVGYSGLKNSVLIAGHNMTTNTPVNWFASYGLIFGSIFTYTLLTFARSMTTRVGLFFLIFLSIFLSISTENYLWNISVISFLLFPLVNCNDEQKIVRAKSMNRRIL
ncbi:hypothetical protein [Acetivibrio cellulolyticus]|uniref:hypothetical protein n=1 Tax=Acetivibrio cellulolyticus TaxID=35830 RepID=UPI0001E2E280|nr:hypothetical protein [Acetivibrio cellulolyticus]